MAEFFDWDRAEQGHAAPSVPEGLSLGSDMNLDLDHVKEDIHDFDLALANIDGDDASFWALEHFQTSNLLPEPLQADPKGFRLCEFEQKPCDACDAGGFDCKRIVEDKCRACCTTCVALNIKCSLSSGENASGGTPGLSPPAEWPPGAEHLVDHVQPHDPRSSSSPDLANLAAGIDSGNDNSANPPAAPKIGARFSRESVRILKAWLSTHAHRPYPNDDERENLQRQTGLNRTQIANWLANARRRSKQKIHHPTRSTSPSVRTWAGAVEIPQRRGNAGRDAEFLSPLQRWQNSPPENEPASVTAIASAILRSDPSSHYESGINSPFNITDDDVAPSIRGSSASSFGTSPSTASFASAFSKGSRSSIGSLQQRGRRRRRRRATPKDSNQKVSLNAPLKQFQCTFCTETFRTKHDWQRHEKSLHLSLEQWVCCPKGPRALNPDNNQVCCVLCGIIEPGSAHIESHNYTSCQERSLDERTFYRKDHLRQHLKLVHNTKYTAWAMDSWKVPTPDIRSRCGFCGLMLNSWPARVDHLAEHFKTGSDMLNWTGDWGFEPAVFSMVENAIPPYMIHGERATPLPFQASQTNSESPRNAYELIKLELAYWLQDRMDEAGGKVSDDDQVLEACRIIYASEVLSQNEHPPPSWLRALFMSSSSEDISRRARMGPIRSQAESCLRHLRVNGKDNIFEDCPLEQQLDDFVKARTILGLTATNEELRVEACKIIARMEESSIIPSEHIANLFLRLICKDTSWLSGFRQRVGLDPTDDSAAPLPGKGPIDSSIHGYSQLDPELADFAKNYKATTGTYPSDEELRKHASCVVHQCQDDWKHTAANNAIWLNAFKERHFEKESQIDSTDLMQNQEDAIVPGVSSASTIVVQPSFAKHSHFFLNASCYRRLAWDLERFVAAAMSPNNPNRHVPTDEELKHQARCILYDDDDPFNHTAADNAEWLLRFKRSAGLLPATEGDGLPEYLWKGGLRRAQQWRDSTPTSLQNKLPSSEATPASLSMQPMQIDTSSPLPDPGIDHYGAMDIQTITTTTAATNIITSTAGAATGAVFANRDFEDKLVQFAVSEVASSGRMPPDAAIQARARELAGFEVWQAAPTPADDPVLLAKFKALVVDKVKAVLGDHTKENGGGSGSIIGTTTQRAGANSSGTNLSPPLDHAPAERGLDAIDPGLLPALKEDLGVDRIGSVAETAPTVHVAISESRLDEIISEALRR
ncbi:unnamed protein product [Discula destructiva]